jgi:carbonic anhydrase
MHMTMKWFAFSILFHMKAYPCFILVLVLHYLHASESLAANYTYDNLFGWPQDCNIGMLQSPIDLSRATSTNYCDYNKVRIGFQDGKQQLIAKTGSTSLEMRQHSSIISVVDYDRRVIEYLGESLSFHAPSEHTIDGNRFDL